MGKVKPSRRSLRFGTQFERRCRCLLHDGTEEYERLFRTSSKEFEKQKLQNLIDERLISPKAKWICSNCLSLKAKNKSESSIKEPDLSLLDSSNLESSNLESSDIESSDLESSDNTSSSQSYDQKSLKSVCDALEKGVIDGEDLVTLSKAFGTCLRRSVNNDTSLNGRYKEINSLKELQCQEFLKQRPVELIELINSACGIDIDSGCISSKKLSVYCLLIEQLYFLKNLNFIGPFSFSQNIVKWTLSGSKTSVAVDGATSAAGSVTTLKKVLQDSSVDENKCFQSGDVDVFFDNTQRVGKTRRVREGGSTLMDIATNVVFIQKHEETNIQQDSNYIPEVWMSKEPENASELHDTCLQNFNIFKRNSQADIINKVSTEIIYDTESVEFRDHVSVKTMLHSMEIDKNVCVNCMKTYEKTSRYCPNCKHDPNFYNERSVLYNDVPSCHHEQPAKVKMGEVVGVNPNSRESVKTVLKNVLNQCDVGLTRQWVRIGCDGVPYSIADSLIDSLVVCSICNEEIDLQKRSFELHVTERHSGSTENVGFTKVFGNILLTPGAGHIEINLLRSCFAFCKHIFIEHVAQLLGFCSQKAKDFIVNCGNHHLSWQIAMIIYHAFSQEMIYTYVVQCNEENQELSIENFVQWKQNVKNQNVLFYYDLIFNIFLGLKCFRSGIRRNNSVYSLAGRQIASLIFFIGSHRIYQRLVCRDLILRACAPPPVKEYIQSTESYSVTGDNTKGEGGDYITENQNRILKQHLPPGVPTFSGWQTASRCDETLRQIRSSLFSRLGMKDPGTDDTVTLNHDSEIQMLRRVIRSSKLFDKPYEEAPVKALNGSIIHGDLIFFFISCK